MVLKKTLEKIVKTYGATSQIDMAIEEMSELTKALLKHRRAMKYGGDIEKCAAHVSEEMADVWVMLQQLEIIFDNAAEVNKNIEYKVDRQIKRMKEREEKQ